MKLVKASLLSDFVFLWLTSAESRQAKEPFAKVTEQTWFVLFRNVSFGSAALM